MGDGLKPILQENCKRCFFALLYDGHPAVMPNSAVCDTAQDTLPSAFRQGGSNADCKPVHPGFPRSPARFEEAVFGFLGGLTKNKLDMPPMPSDNEPLTPYLYCVLPREVPVLRRLASSVLRWGVVGVLVATSLLGGELHSILGIRHSWQRGRCGWEGAACAVESGTSVAGGHCQSCDDGTNCPICSFLAQGRIVGERFEAVSVTLSVPNRSPAIPLFAPSLHLRPFQSRAPPAA